MTDPHHRPARRHVVDQAVLVREQLDELGLQPARLEDAYDMVRALDIEPAEKAALFREMDTLFEWCGRRLDCQAVEPLGLATSED